MLFLFLFIYLFQEPCTKYINYIKGKDVLYHI